MEPDGRTSNSVSATLTNTYQSDGTLATQAFSTQAVTVANLTLNLTLTEDLLGRQKKGSKGLKGRGRKRLKKG
jgi:hypothetical protein